MATYDAIILGAGGVGSAALAVAARRGLRVLGLDRFSPPHDRGSSHGQTRLIRQAYFEHPDYVPLVRHAYEMWRELEAQTRSSLLTITGLVEFGPPEGIVIPGVRASAVEHGIAIEELTSAEAHRRWPGLSGAADLSAVYETSAGFLLVERAVQAHLDVAVQHGADLRFGEGVERWSAERGRVVVETATARYEAARLIIAAGPWAGSLLAELGIRLVVRRKSQFWFAAPEAYRADRDFPAFFYETADGSYFYGVPQVDARGVKVAEHSGGEAVADPLTVDREARPPEVGRVEEFVAKFLPPLAGSPTSHAVCMYTMTADEHFVVDRHPRHENVVFALGLSGHGFKFTPVLGEALVELAFDGHSRHPIGFLRHDRPGLA